MPADRIKATQGPKEIVLALAPNTSFKDIAKALEVTLTLPKRPGFRGCLPCLSGLDRIVVENPAFRGFR